MSSMDEPTLGIDPLEEKFFRARVQGPWDSEDPWNARCVSSPNTSRPRNSGPLGTLQRLATRSRVPKWQAFAAAFLALLLLVGVGRVFWNAWDLMGAPLGNPSPSLPAAVADLAESEDSLLETRTEPTPFPVTPSTEPEVVMVEVDAATIQVATFRERSNAERLVQTLREKYGQAFLRRLDSDLYSVTMGPYIERQTADGIAEEINAELQLTTLVVNAPMLQMRVAAQ